MMDLSKEIISSIDPNVISADFITKRGRLYDTLKLAAATGAGLVLGAGLGAGFMYFYLKSFSQIGKEVKSVVQSINSLTAELEEMKKHYRLRKRGESTATSYSSDDEITTVCERNSKDVSNSIRRASSSSTSNTYASASDERGRSRSKSRTVSDEESVYEEALSDVSSTAEELSVMNSSTREDDFKSVNNIDELPRPLKDIIDEVDQLFEGTSNQRSKAYVLLKESQSSFSSYADFMWRLAKATHNEAQIEGVSGDQSIKKDLLLRAFDYAKAGLEIRSEDADIQKWYAITLGSISEFQGTQERILNGFKFKDHIVYAIQLRPDDPTLHYLLGRWCYAVYMLSWLERRAAAALFAEPPSSSIEEALEHFSKAEKLRKTAWKGNKLMIAKCYIQLNELDKVQVILKSAFSISMADHDDQEAHQEIITLLSKYGAES